MLLTLLANTTDGTQTTGFNWISLLLPLALIVMFIFMTSSQKKQEKKIADMRNNLQVGDEITTIGGIIGKVVSIKEETAVIETSGDKTKIRIFKSAVKTIDVKAEDCE